MLLFLGAHAGEASLNSLRRKVQFAYEGQRRRFEQQEWTSQGDMLTNKRLRRRREGGKVSLRI